ncbi:MAG: ISL3 family transposase [Bacteriovoracaceae bacterium]
MPKLDFTHSLQLPELKIGKFYHSNKNTLTFDLFKQSDFEVCPKCASPSKTIYDHVSIQVKDSPIRNRHVLLNIKKRRFYCKFCKKPFTEPIAGIKKGFRTTDRFRRHIMWCADNFANLHDVEKQLGISSWLVHTAYYEQLELQVKKLQNPWDTTIGIDEHAVRKNKKRGYREFATIFVEYSHKRVRELVLGRSPSELLADERLISIPGRENVKNVIIDLSKNYRKLARELFPNARIIADRFHVIRLFNNILNNYRKLSTGDVRKNPIRKLLLKKNRDLEPYVRRVLDSWLDQNPLVKEVYHLKESMHRFYRIKGKNFARKILIKITDQMALSKIPEIKTLRETIHNWREAILMFFENGLTNGRTEGFNRVAKLIQRNAYGFRNIENYRRRLIYKTS